MPSRLNLRFPSGSVSDDSLSDATIVNFNVSITDAEWSSIQGILA